MRPEVSEAVLDFFILAFRNEFASGTQSKSDSMTMGKID